MDKQSPELRKSLKHYVHRPMDPRNGQTFHLETGWNDRVFQHVKDELKLRGSFFRREAGALRNLSRFRSRVRVLAQEAPSPGDFKTDALQQQVTSLRGAKA